MADPVLAADIGGTNARFALAEFSGEDIRIRDWQSFRAEDFESVRDAAAAYLEAVGVKPRHGCFAVAAPLDGNVVEFTNSPWTFVIDDVQKALSLTQLFVVNDFEALASGVRFLKEPDTLSVKPGVADANAPILVIGPGTGLGQALVVPYPGNARIVSTEGGHVSYAPRTDEERAVCDFIAREHPRVSAERLLSGRGLVNIHRALCAISGKKRISLRADEISKAAIDGAYPAAVRAVDLFCEMLGRTAGDGVLSAGARGGVMLGGGILPKILDIFLKSRFTECFLDKGRMRDYVEPVPIDLIIRDDAAILGAAAVIKDKVNEH